jgi:hypothetical protein
MAGVEKISLARLPAGERAELEALFAAHKQGRAGERFLSDFGDAAAWWLLLTLAALGGAVAAGLSLFEEGAIGVADYLRALVESGPVVFVGALYVPGFVVSLAVLAWVGVAFARNLGRRGFAITGFGIVRVKGPRLRLLRHVDITRAERTVHRSKGGRFTTLDLSAKDGSRLSLDVAGGWARAALEEVERARSAAGLPPLAK